MGTNAARGVALLLLAALLGAIARPVVAEDTPALPYYIVQPGDTLSAIAYRFGLSLDALAEANHITDPAALQVGQKLVIPGLEGVQGELTTRSVTFGDTLRGLSRSLGLREALLARLNHVVSPAELFAGRSLIVTAQQAQRTTPRRILGDAPSLLDAALTNQSSPWALALTNQLPGTWAMLPADVLMVPGTEGEGPTGLPEGWQMAALPKTWTQGHTGEVRVTVPRKVATLSGTFGKHELHFFPWEEGQWVALQGVFALADPGLYPLQVVVNLADGETFAFEQPILVERGNYASERLVVPANLLNPQLNKEEEARFERITAPATPTRYWAGKFQAPEKPPLDDCHPSYFGTRRNYNDTFFWYHTGLDFCGRVGTPIYAPAEGVVVFVGTTEIHGKVTIIDHGWGVYTTYCHQSEILVQAGQRVHPGDLIGKVGNTGRVTGPHLHWEVWVGSVPVEPLEWLQRAFP